MRLALCLCACAALLSIAVFFGSSTASMLQIGRMASEIEDCARQLRQGISMPLSNLATAVADLKQIMGQFRELVERPQVQRSMGLLAQSGDDLARIFKRTNQTLDILQEGIKSTDVHLNQQTLPALTQAIQQTEAISSEAQAAIAASRVAIEATQADLHSTAQSLSDTLAGALRTASAATETIEAMRLIAVGPMTASLQNVERGTLAGAITLENTQKITERWAKPMKGIWNFLSGVSSFAYRTFVKP